MQQRRARIPARLLSHEQVSEPSAVASHLKNVAPFWNGIKNDLNAVVAKVTLDVLILICSIVNEVTVSVPTLFAGQVMSHLITLSLPMLPTRNASLHTRPD